jgi:hypothetical protein
MKTPLIIAAIGNLIDTVSTLYLNGRGYTEANPFMSALLPYPALFVSVKIGAMALVIWILWKNRESQIARITAWFAAGLYGLIAVYYLVVFPLLTL